MRKFQAGIAAVVTGAIVSIFVTVGMASAHIPQVTPSCTGLKIELTLYEGDATNNQVQISIDGSPPGGVNFASGYSHTFPWSETADHSYSVTIDANRVTGNPTQYDAVFSGSWKACKEAAPTTTTPPTTSTAVTTTTVGDTPTTVAEPTTTVAVVVGPTTTVAETTTTATATVVDTGTPALVHLPNTGTPAENNALIALAVFALGMLFWGLARRRRHA